MRKKDVQEKEVVEDEIHVDFPLYWVLCTCGVSFVPKEC